MTASPDVIAAANAYMDRGFSIVAVKPDKKPWGNDWRRKFSQQEIISRLKGAECNSIGFLGGALNSNIVPIDFDSPEGEAWWREQCEAAGIDPNDFPTVITPGKIKKDGTRIPGKHRYVTDTLGTLGNADKGVTHLGIDVRGKGHAMLPPSPHPDGGNYRWLDRHRLDDFDTVPPCPNFFYDALAKRETPETPPRSNGAHQPTDVGDRERHFARVALDKIAHEIGTTQAGKRNQALNRAAFYMGGMIVLGWITDGEVRSTLLAAAHRCGLVGDDGEKAAKDTINSGITAGIAEPHKPLEDRPPEKRHALVKSVDEPAADERPADDGAKAPDDGAGERPLVLPPPAQPMQVAREFVDRHGMADGVLKLRYWRGGWWAWRGTHWRERKTRSVMAALYRFTEHALFLKETGLAPWAPNHRKIGDLLEALQAVTFLRDEFDQPSWLDKRQTGTIVATANGLLDVESEHLYAHTPKFFNVVHVPFNYDPRAPEPATWLKFLGELWPHEPASIDVLSEWFGYVISGRTDLQKILLMVGPTRGGKGVIARTLTGLIGRKNVAGPTLNSLGGDFGLAPLIGKPLAIISDARFSEKNSNTVVERLLSISGEDMLTVNIKYQEQWTGQLPCRLHVISNELPKLGDASMAIVGRLVLLLLSNSWLGKEDIHLERKLRDELPGILNWSLKGLRRLTANEGFTRITTTDDAVAAMRDLASPVAAFVRERCKLGSESVVTVDNLYAAFRTWADGAGHTKKAKHVFGRDLMAAHASVRKSRLQLEKGKKREHVYTGIELRPTDDGDDNDEAESGSYNAKLL